MTRVLNQLCDEFTYGEAVKRFYYLKAMEDRHMDEGEEMRELDELLKCLAFRLPPLEPSALLVYDYEELLENGEPIIFGDVPYRLYPDPIMERAYKRIIGLTAESQRALIAAIQRSIPSATEEDALCLHRLLITIQQED